MPSPWLLFLNYKCCPLFPLSPHTTAFLVTDWYNCPPIAPGAGIGSYSSKSTRPGRSPALPRRRPNEQSASEAAQYDGGGWRLVTLILTKQRRERRINRGALGPVSNFNNRKRLSIPICPWSRIAVACSLAFGILDKVGAQADVGALTGAHATKAVNTHILLPAQTCSAGTTSSN
ncbi:hypothetical protein A9K55_008521 [Cordyceps militaris]|uniref:Uncharacterized protein n=1 Tax=Cordyceps militaris TaxID=73501 RepID=A0A2H4SE23_CORMI|nr:hypothetical protein A9K55_008521 [Cordyceps militaris]